MSSIKHNGLWRGIERFNLVRNMRADNDVQFATWLLQLGNCQLPAVDGVRDTVRICQEMGRVAARLRRSEKLYITIDTGRRRSGQFPYRFPQQFGTRRLAAVPADD